MNPEHVKTEGAKPNSAPQEQALGTVRVEAPAWERLETDLTEFLSREALHFRQLMEDEDAKHRAYWAPRKSFNLFPDLPSEDGRHSVMGGHYAGLLANAEAARESAGHGRHDDVFMYVERQLLESADGQSASSCDLDQLRALEFQLCEREHLTFSSVEASNHALGLFVGQQHHHDPSNSVENEGDEQIRGSYSQYLRGNPLPLLSLVERALGDAAAHKRHIDLTYQDGPVFRENEGYEMAMEEHEALHGSGTRFDDFARETRKIWATLYVASKSGKR